VGRPGEDELDGRTGWIVVAATIVATFTVYGVLYSFGAFLIPIAREFGAGRGQTSILFGLTAFCNFLLGAVSGALSDRFGPRRVVLAGALAMGGGLFLTAVVPALWLAYVTYGLGVGVGVACGNIPMVATVGGWFDRRRSLALGVAGVGIGMGTLTGAPLAAVLIDRVGWRQTEAAFGVCSVLLLAACALVARRPPGPARRAPLVTVVRSRWFVLMYLSSLLTAFALFVAFVHIAPYAVKLGVPPVAAAALVGVIGVGGILGRPVLGWVGQRLRPVRTFQLCVALVGLSFVVWYVAPGYPALVAFALVLGLGYGGWAALIPSVMAELFGVAGLGASIGALSTSAGVGALVGPPLAGFLVDATGGYRLAILAAVALAIAAGLLVAPLPAGDLSAR
jgi:MFS family permease